MFFYIFKPSLYRKWWILFSTATIKVSHHHDHHDHHDHHSVFQPQLHGTPFPKTYMTMIAQSLCWVSRVCKCVNSVKLWISEVFTIILLTDIYQYKGVFIYIYNDEMETYLWSKSAWFERCLRWQDRNLTPILDVTRFLTPG